MITYLFQYLINSVNSGSIAFSNSVINISAKTSHKGDPIAPGTNLHIHLSIKAKVDLFRTQ